MISSECTHCHKSYQIDDIYVGKEAECPNCKERFIINKINSNSLVEKDVPSMNSKKKLLIIIITLAITLAILMWYEKINTWRTENKRNETLSNPVDLGECKTFTDKLKSCEAFTCEYDSINWMIEGKIHTKFDISWNINSCNLLQRNTIDWKPSYGYSCKDLSEEESRDLSSYLDSTLNSNWNNFSYETNNRWEVKLKINWKEIKDMLNKLQNNGKCSMEIKK